MWEEVRDEDGRLLFRVNRIEATIETFQSYWDGEKKKRIKRTVVTKLTQFFPLVPIHALSVQLMPMSNHAVRQSQGVLHDSRKFYPSSLVSQTDAEPQ
jgi:hypothetical protein